MNGDFSADPFVGLLTNPYANVNGVTGEPSNFQCNAGVPTPILADGSQVLGTAVQYHSDDGGGTDWAWSS